MTSTVIFLAGLATGLALWAALRPVLARPLFARENHRGKMVPTAAGIVLPLAALAVEAGATLYVAATDRALAAPAARGSSLGAALGFGLLGLIDDLAGPASGPGERGFAGHLRALFRGRLTTGGLKLLGGGAVAVVVCASVDTSRISRLVPDAALVALAANLGNLFDRAPGRAAKVGGLAFVALVASQGAAPELAGAAGVVGATAALSVPDLRERLMLGDAGANVLGAVLGLAVVLSCSPGVRLVALAAVAALNLASEVVSFSRVIDRVGPLRALDRAGRRPPPPPP